MFQQEDRVNERLSEEDLADMSVAVAVDVGVFAIRKMAAMPIPVSPVCLNCGEPTGDRRWCDKECQEEWTADNAMRAQLVN